MKAEIDTDILLPAAKAIEDVVEEVILQFGEDGLHVRAADRAMVRIIELEIEADVFATYETDGTELAPVVAEKLRKAVDATNETVTLESDGRALTIAEDGMEISIRHLNQNEDDIPGTSQMDHPAEAAIDAGVLKNNMSHASMAADKVAFHADEESVELEADGDTESFRNTIAPTLRFDADGRTRTLMKIENIRAATKAVKRIDSAMTVYMGDEYPMKFEADTDAVDLKVFVAMIEEGAV